MNPKATRIVSAAPTTWIRRLVAKLCGTFPIPDTPHLDAGALDYFNNRINHTRFYLEYGSGGSTIVAARANKPFVSVETDVLFMRLLKRKLSRIPNNSGGVQALMYRYIGITGAWGNPLFKKTTKKRMKRWQNYCKAPWAFIEEGGYPIPDTVLIDGRFRVACALESLKHLAKSPDARLLFDDYSDRKRYHVIAEFGELEEYHGRLAVFRPKADLDLVRLEAMFQEYVNDCR